MKQKIKVGDRVRIVREWADGHFGLYDGKTGTVTETYQICGQDCLYPFRVRPDEWVDPLMDGILCYKVEPLKPEKQPVIVITSDGKTTVATKRLGKRVLGRCVAVCADDDEFDFDIGASIALGRLVGAKIQFEKDEKPIEEEPKNFSGTVVCLESNEPLCWTPGRTYEVRDGLIVDDLGNVRSRPARDFNDFYTSWWYESDSYVSKDARFAEVVERS